MQGARGAALTRSPAVLLLHIAALVVTVDQATKCAVVSHFAHHPPVRLLGGALYIEEARNGGAAFSFAGGSTIIFTLIALGVIVAIIRASRRLQSLAWTACLGLVLGGALGNLFDRVLRSPSPLRGHVVDWIDLRVWPVFNLADSAIVVGGALGVLLSLRGVAFDQKAGAAPDLD